MRRLTIVLMLLVLVAGCVTARQGALRYGYAVRVSAEIARDTTKIMHAHDLITDEDCAKVRATYEALRDVSIRYAALLEAMPETATWTPQDIVATQVALDALLRELEGLVEAAIKED